MGLAPNASDKWILNIFWVYIYLFNVWECLIEEWFDLYFNDDKGRFYNVCYQAFTAKLSFWESVKSEKEK